MANKRDWIVKKPKFLQFFEPLEFYAVSKSPDHFSLIHQAKNILRMFLMKNLYSFYLIKFKYTLINLTVFKKECALFLSLLPQNLNN